MSNLALVQLLRPCLKASALAGYVGDAQEREVTLQERGSEKVTKDLWEVSILWPVLHCKRPLSEFPEVLSKTLSPQRLCNGPHLNRGFGKGVGRKGVCLHCSDFRPYPQFGWDFPEEIPERPRKHSRSVSWNFPRKYGWDAPSPIIQGIWGFHSVSRNLSPPNTAGDASELVMEFPAVLGAFLRFVLKTSYRDKPDENGANRNKSGYSWKQFKQGAQMRTNRKRTGKSEQIGVTPILPTPSGGAPTKSSHNKPNHPHVRSWAIFLSEGLWGSVLAIPSQEPAKLVLRPTGLNLEED